MPATVYAPPAVICTLVDSNRLRRGRGRSPRASPRCVLARGHLLVRGDGAVCNVGAARSWRASCRTSRGRHLPRGVRRQVRKPDPAGVAVVVGRGRGRGGTDAIATPEASAPKPSTDISAGARARDAVDLNLIKVSPCLNRACRAGQAGWAPDTRHEARFAVTRSSPRRWLMDGKAVAAR